MANTLKSGSSLSDFGAKVKAALTKIHMLQPIKDDGPEQNDTNGRQNNGGQGTVRRVSYDRTDGRREQGRAQNKPARSQERREENNVPQKKRDTVIIYVNKYERCKDAILEVIDGSAVIVYLEDTDNATKQRIVDVLAGAAFALKANIRKISDDNYFIAPYGMNINIIKTVKKRF